MVAPYTSAFSRLRDSTYGPWCILTQHRMRPTVSAYQSMPWTRGHDEDVTSNRSLPTSAAVEDLPKPRLAAERPVLVGAWRTDCAAAHIGVGVPDAPSLKAARDAYVQPRQFGMYSQGCAERAQR